MLTYSNGYWEVYIRFQIDFFGWGGGVVEKRGICWGISPWSNLSRGKKISMKGAQDFLALLKNNKKINIKKFFHLTVRSRIKTNKNYYAHEVIRPLLNTSLFTLKYF